MQAIDRTRPGCAGGNLKESQDAPWTLQPRRLTLATPLTATQVGFRSRVGGLVAKATQVGFSSRAGKIQASWVGCSGLSGPPPRRVGSSSKAHGHRVYKLFQGGAGPPLHGGMLLQGGTQSHILLQKTRLWLFVPNIGEECVINCH